MTVVKSHLRKTSKGKKTRVKRHTRKSIRTIPVITSNKSLTGAAQYNPKSKMLNLIIDDEDDDKITTTMQAIPIEPTKIEVEESNESDTLAINIIAKKKRFRTRPDSQTIISELPKFREEDIKPIVD